MPEPDPRPEGPGSEPPPGGESPSRATPSEGAPSEGAPSEGAPSPEPPAAALDALRADVEALREELPGACASAVAQELRSEGTPSQAAGEPLLSAGDVARRLDVSKRTVERLVADGELRPLWIKGQRRFTPATVDAYLRNAARTKRPSTKRPSTKRPSTKRPSGRGAAG